MSLFYVSKFQGEFPFDSMTACIERMDGEVDDAGAFCAAWYHDTHGEWPGAAKAETTYFQLVGKDWERDEFGRFAEVDGGALAETAIEQGGFTYEPVTGNSPTEGVAVSPYPEHSHHISGEASVEEIADEIEQYVADQGELLEDLDHHLGGWYDEVNDEVVLDVSVVRDREEAIGIMEEFGEDAVFDLGALEEIRREDVTKHAEAEPAGPGGRWEARGVPRARKEDQAAARAGEARLFWIEGQVAKHDHWERDERGRFAETGAGGAGGGEPLNRAQVGAHHADVKGRIGDVGGQVERAIVERGENQNLEHARINVAGADNWQEMALEGVREGDLEKAERRLGHADELLDDAEERLAEDEGGGQQYALDNQGIMDHAGDVREDVNAVVNEIMEAEAEVDFEFRPEFQEAGQIAQQVDGVARGIAEDAEFGMEQEGRVAEIKHDLLNQQEAELERARGVLRGENRATVGSDNMMEAPEGGWTEIDRIGIHDAQRPFIEKGPIGDEKIVDAQGRVVQPGNLARDADLGDVQAGDFEEPQVQLDPNSNVRNPDETPRGTLNVKDRGANYRETGLGQQGSAERFAQRADAMQNSLANAEIVAVEEMGDAQGIEKVTMSDGMVMMRRPDGGTPGGGGYMADRVATNDYAASKVAEAIGMGDQVPAVVTENTAGDEIVAYQEFMADADVMGGDPHDLRALDTVIGNSDRHGGNTMRDADGTTIGIDHGLARFDAQTGDFGADRVINALGDNFDYDAAIENLQEARQEAGQSGASDAARNLDNVITTLNSAAALTGQRQEISDELAGI